MNEFFNYLNDNIFLKTLFDFIFIFSLIYIFTILFINKNKKDYSKLKSGDLVLSFIKRYKLDMKKTSYKSVLNIITIVNTFIMTFASILVVNIKGFLLPFIIAFVVIIILIYSLYEIVGRYLKRKEDEK